LDEIDVTAMNNLVETFFLQNGHGDFGAVVTIRAAENASVGSVVANSDGPKLENALSHFFDPSLERVAPSNEDESEVGVKLASDDLSEAAA
jgi:hypothetical protein